MARWPAALFWLAACGARPHASEAARPVGGDEITLYRDRALIQQRVAVDVPEAGNALAHAVLGAGVTLAEVQVIDPGALTVEISATDAPRAVAADAGVDAEVVPVDEDYYDPRIVPEADGGVNVGPASKPLAVDLAVTAPHAGHYVIELAYTTTALTWSAAYTLTTTPARDEVRPRGAIAIANATGVTFSGARVAVLEASLGPVPDSIASEISAYRTHRPLSDAHPARVHELGRLDVTDGEISTELYAPDATRALRSVLVYDPIGTRLDNPQSQSVHDNEQLGVRPPAPTRVVESAEIARDPEADAGLPGGAARLVERQPDGALVVLADGRMFDPATRVAAFDTIALGTARGVTGHRARRDYALDVEQRRLTEDFTIDLVNSSAKSVEVIVVEHLYRTVLWSIGFSSTPAAKVGMQSISMRAEVPAHGKASVMYVVEYVWDAR